MKDSTQWGYEAEDSEVLASSAAGAKSGFPFNMVAPKILQHERGRG